MEASSTNPPTWIDRMLAQIRPPAHVCSMRRRRVCLNWACFACDLYNSCAVFYGLGQNFVRIFGLRINFVKWISLRLKFWVNQDGNFSANSMPFFSSVESFNQLLHDCKQRPFRATHNLAADTNETRLERRTNVYLIRHAKQYVNFCQLISVARENLKNLQMKSLKVRLHTY